MEKAEFRNDSRGVCGVVVIPAGEKPRGLPVKPGETIWLTEEEQIATANAPRNAEDNPFVNGTLSLATEPKDIVNRRPIGHTEAEQAPMSEADQEKADEKRQQEEEAKKRHLEQEQQRQVEAQEQAEAGAKPVKDTRLPNEETGVQVDPVGEAPQGERAQDEEVGTPAPKRPMPKPKPVSAR